MCLCLSPVLTSSVTPLYNQYQEVDMDIIHRAYLDFTGFICTYLCVEYARVGGWVGVSLCNFITSLDSWNHTTIKIQNRPVTKDIFPMIPPSVPPRLLPFTLSLSRGNH